MQFEEFIGNDSIVEAMKASVASGRIANAYLFSGPKSLGKFTLATIISSALLCKSEAKPCGKCTSCVRIQAQLNGEGFHPDFHVIEPDGKMIKVEQIREQLIATTRMKPVESDYQAFIINPADVMHPSAANAFLKTLEEAPGKSVFFLITVNPGALLQTIKSRCHVYTFQPTSQDVLAEKLIERNLSDKENAHLVAGLSRGAPGEAVSFDFDLFESERKVALEFVQVALDEGSVESLFKVSAQLHSQPENFQNRMRMIVTLLRDVMLLASARSEARIVNIDIESDLLHLARGRSARKIARLISLIADMNEPLLRNVRIDSVSEQIMISGRRSFKK